VGKTNVVQIIENRSKTIIKIIIAGISGFLFGVFLELYALMMSGAGHGWNDAGRYGVMVLIACPLVAISTVGKSIGYKTLAVIALFIGLVIDVNLILSIYEGYEYFEKVFFFGVIWLFLMFSWQLLAILILVFNREKIT